MGKKSQKTKTTYGNTTTTNPYVTATTTNKGTTTQFNDGTALNSVYNYVNNSMDNLLNEYLNPSLDSATNRAKISEYTNNLNKETKNSLENNIINPLSNRNMIRSSQATDLYNNLAASNSNALGSYLNQLLSESQANTGNVLTTLLNAYLQGYNVASGTQAQSLETSKGNATSTTSTSGGLFNDILGVAYPLVKLASPDAGAKGKVSK